MELVYFTVVAAGLYLFSDLVLRGAENVLGRRFEQRSLIFFAILLGSALVTFALIRNLFGA